MPRLALFFLLSILSAACLAGAYARADSPLEERTELFLIFRNEKPAGYSRTTLSPLESADEEAAPAWSIHSEIHLHFNLGDKSVETVQTTTEIINENLRLLSATGTVQVGDDTYGLEAYTVKKSLFVTARYGGDELRSEVAYPLGSVPLSAVPLLLAGMDLQKPPKRLFKVLNSDLTRMYISDLAVAAAGTSTMEIDGEKIKVTMMHARIDDAEYIFKIDKKGNVYEAAMPAVGIIQRRISEEDLAAVSEWLDLDFTRAAYFMPAKIIENPAVLEWLELDLEWKDVDPKGLMLKSNNQRVLKSAYKNNIARVQLRISFRSTETVRRKRLSRAQLRKYLESDDKIETTNADIVRAARRAAEDAEDPLDEAVRIAQWIHNNIFPDPAAWLNDHKATTTLKTRRGMNKHAAILFAAMARSRDIPTRICAGKIYSMGLFVTHFWNEIYVDGRWLTIDATAVNPAAPPPLRIKLAHADNTHEATAIADSVIKSLFIQVRDFATR